MKTTLHWLAHITGHTGWMVSGLGGWVVVGLITLARTPLVWLDEGLYTQPAWSFASSGTFGMPMFADLHGYDQTNVAFGRIYQTGVAIAFKLFGLGPFQARLLSLAAGLAVILLTFLLGRALWNARAGTFAAIALGVSPVFWMQTHDARPEMLLLAFFVAALYVAVRSEGSGRARGYVVAGLIAGLAADIHLNGVLIPFVLVFFVAIRSGSRRLLLRRSVAIGIGTALGWLWWVSVHVLPDPALFVDQWSTGISGVLPIQLLGVDPRTVLIAEPLRFLQAALRWWPLAWILPLGAIVGAVIVFRHHRERGVLAVIGATGAMIVLMALLVAHKAPTYAVLVWPFGALLVGRWLSTLDRFAGVGVLIATSVASILAIAIVTVSTWQGDYDRFVGELRSHIPAGATIQGEPTYWFGLADHPYIADQYFGPEMPYADAVRRLGIQYIIADEYFFDTLLTVQQSVDENQVLDFLASHTVLVAEVHDPQYGGAAWGQSLVFPTSVYESGDHITRIYRVLP